MGPANNSGRGGVSPPSLAQKGGETPPLPETSATHFSGKRPPAAVSLFSGAGIGDLGFRAAGIDVLALCEIAADRAALARLNFPAADVVTADVRDAEEAVCAAVAGRLAPDEELF